MPDLIPYHLSFSGGLHIGTQGVDLEESAVTIPSDTLFSALAVSLRRMGREIDTLLAPFFTPTPAPLFLLTSAFPRVGQIRFYPMPINPEAIFTPKTIQAQGKALKRVKFLSEGLLRKALSGKKLDEDLFSENDPTPGRGFAIQGGALWLSAAEIVRLPPGFQREKGKEASLRYVEVWVSERTPRVTIGRVTSASNIFHAGRVKFAQECGLWFGVHWPKAVPALAKDVEQALAFLQHAGLGGERTSGYGAFTFETAEKVSLPDPTGGQVALLLSRYHPRAEELPSTLTHAGAAYELVPVAGWLNSPGTASQRRKRLLMVAEGSLICPPTYPAGDVRDVRPVYGEAGGAGVAHPVYRAGLALTVGWPQ